MHTRERRSALLAALKEKKKVTVAELAKEFEVTTMTVRRDLKRLADENIVTLVHGGAIYNEGGTALASVGVRALLNQQGKSQLGRYCARLVQEGNAIYLDSGSTCMSIAARPRRTPEYRRPDQFTRRDEHPRGQHRAAALFHGRHL